MDLASWTQLALRNKLPSGLDWLAGRCAACQQLQASQGCAGRCLGTQKTKLTTVPGKLVSLMRLVHS